jgi:hypothetical protein
MVGSTLVELPGLNSGNERRFRLTLERGHRPPFPRLLAILLPKVGNGYRLDYPYELLDSELQAVVREAEQGRRPADSLIRVRRLPGDSQLVLVHVSQHDRDFSRRMLLYHTRLRDRFNQPVCSLAILGDGRQNWRPDRHLESFWGCRLELQFPVRKLLDFPDWVDSTVNPFAWLTAAHLQARATRKQSARRADQNSADPGPLRLWTEPGSVARLVSAAGLGSGPASQNGV